MTPETPPHPPRKASWKRWSLALAGVLAMVLLVLFLKAGQQSGTRCVTTVVWTNVTSVTASVTHGPNHFYYYPSRLRYEWDKLRQKMGIKVKNPAERQVFSRSPTCDVLWVKITFGDKKYRPYAIGGEQIDAKGQAHSCGQVARPTDATRPVSLNAFTLEGPLQREELRKFRIRSLSGRVLAEIEIR